MMGFEEITAENAVAQLKHRNIKVQTATPRTKPGKAINGKAAEVASFDVQYEPLRPEFVLSAKQYHDGRVSIVTIDGQRHEWPERTRAEEVQ